MAEETDTEQVVANSYFRDISARFPKDPVKRSLLLLVLLIALPLLVIFVQRAVRYLGRAATASLYFEPVSADLPPDMTLRLMTDSGVTQMGFAMVEVSFDPTQVNLTSEVVTSDRLTMNNAQAETDPNYSPPQYACQGTDPCIIKTPMAIANSSGTINIVLGMDPTSSQTAPDNIFELARFTFTPVTTQNINTQVSVSNFQLVDMSATDFNVTVQGPATLTLNPTPATGTPTATVTPTGTTPPGPPGDLDGDGDVDIFDYNQLVTDFDWTGTPGAIPADIDDDGDVDIFDYNILVSNFGT
jgi:hypothetical protein